MSDLVVYLWFNGKEVDHYDFPALPQVGDIVNDLSGAMYIVVGPRIFDRASKSVRVYVRPTAV